MREDSLHLSLAVIQMRDLVALVDKALTVAMFEHSGLNLDLIPLTYIRFG